MSRRIIAFTLGLAIAFGSAAGCDDFDKPASTEPVASERAAEKARTAAREALTKMMKAAEKATASCVAGDMRWEADDDGNVVSRHYSRPCIPERCEPSPADVEALRSSAKALKTLVDAEEIAGTTRDSIEIRLNLGGYLVTLVDTAGIREASDRLEAEGIRRSALQAETADMRLLVLDATDAADESFFQAWRQPQDVILWNKCDLPNAKTPVNTRAALYVSAATGQGLEELIAALHQQLAEVLSEAEESVITRVRHRAAFEEAETHLNAALDEKALELQGEHLRVAIRALSSLIGVISADNLLDMVFSSFCLGK